MTPPPRFPLRTFAVAAFSAVILASAQAAVAAEVPAAEASEASIGTSGSSDPVSGRAATDASAAPTTLIPPASPYSFRTRIVHKVKQTNRVGRQVLGRCRIAKRGATCTITQGKSATRTVDMSGTLSRGAITASLGISNATTVSVDVGCTSPALKPGETFTAKPVGSKFTYNEKRTNYYLGIVLGSSITKRGLTAFSPYRSQIYCY